MTMQSSLLASENESRPDGKSENKEQQNSQGSSVEELDTSGDDSKNQREGTITSARFNILSSMVGGGSLSLPLAFYQAGNGFLAPVFLICIAGLVEYSIYFLVQAGNHTLKNGTSSKYKGSLAYESVASTTLGTGVGHLSTVLVCTICFFTVAGYGVLLRDMLLPISDHLSTHNDTDGSPTFAQNATMLFVVLLVTPLCTLQNLTALKNIGAASITSIMVLFCCITYRSAECNFSPKYDNIRHMHWKEYISFLPARDIDNSSTSITATLHQLANSLPILITVFMCHFNVLPVHNELHDPSLKRVNRLFTTSIWSAAIFYLLMGFVGSMYGNCTESGLVEGNVLLSFAEDDMLLLLGRGCLSLTIAFALPVFVVPARDMIMRGLDNFYDGRPEGVGNNSVDGGDDGGDVSDVVHHVISSSSTDVHENPLENYTSDNSDLTQPLLVLENGDEGMTDTCRQESHSGDEECDGSSRRIIVSITILWSAVLISCCVKSIDTVWDIMGGSFQIIMGFIIPSASYLSFTRSNEVTAETESNDNDVCVENGYSVADASNTRGAWYRGVAWALLIIFVPVMCICTGNSIHNIMNGN